MDSNKKRTDAATSVPTEERLLSISKHSNYSKIKKLCLAINIIGLIGFMISYHKQAENAMYLWSGVLFTTWIIQAALYPIEEEDEQ